jgi:hypothetical protein
MGHRSARIHTDNRYEEQGNFKFQAWHFRESGKTEIVGQINWMPAWSSRAIKIQAVINL